MSTRHFLTLFDLTAAELNSLIKRGIELKEMLAQDLHHTPLQTKMLALIFDKSSTRTRVSFETGMAQLGGNSMFLSPGDTQLGRGEQIEDTARVMSRMVDAIVIRTHKHEHIEIFAGHSRVPVINALTDMFHPCQLLADIQTYVEHRGDITGKTAVWIGDGNNVCHSWMNAAKLFNFKLNISTPAGYGPAASVLEKTREHVQLFDSPADAANMADIVITDTWASMGQEQEKQSREKAFSTFRVDKELMACADKDALFMHCLPAYRGYEVTADVLEGPQSVVWDEAENRLHAQKALLELLLTN